MNNWYDSAVFYHMYPLGMSGAPLQNKEGEVVHRFDELKKWLPHIKALGCDAIYIGPLFESTTHGYDTKDYRMVDRRLGDNNDFKTFVTEAHQMGLRIVVDGVFNHTGREFFAFQDIQKNRESSRYCGWYKGVNFGWNSPYNDGFGYEAWRNCFELVNLNLQNREVKDYLFDVIRFWIHEFDIDGIRLDCADCLDFDFMKEMRWMTGNEKQDFWLMGEVIHGEYTRWVNSETLHSVTNYNLNKALWSGCNEHNFFEIAHTVKRLYDMGGCHYRNLELYSFADNHDVERIASKIINKDHLGVIYTLMYTLPGIPSIYYGSEFGIEGKKEQGSDASLRPHLELSDYADAMTDNPLTALIAKLGSIHQAQKALCYGEYKELLLTNRQYAFARCYEDEDVITAVNNDEQSTTLHIPYQGPKTQFKGALSGKDYMMQNGSIEITLDACGGDILI